MPANLAIAAMGRSYWLQPITGGQVSRKRRCNHLSRKGSSSLLSSPHEYPPPAGAPALRRCPRST